MSNSQEFRLVTGSYDWAARRLTPRKLYPPRFSAEMGNRSQPLTNADVNPKRFSLISVPDTEAIGITTGKYKGDHVPLVQLGLAYPFREDCLSFAQKAKAQWNDTFNLWEIPILSQSKEFAIREIWGRITDLFVEFKWSDRVIFIHWSYPVPEYVIDKLKIRIKKLNCFWEGPPKLLQEDLFSPVSPELVYRELSFEEIKRRAIAYCKTQKFATDTDNVSNWETLSVNYLRHQESAYHVLLNMASNNEQSYLQVFKKINEQIGKDYPFLAEECQRQIAVRSKNAS